MNRRKNIKILGTLGLISPLNSIFSSTYEKENVAKFDIHLFSKHLQWLDYEEMSKVAKEIRRCRQRIMLLPPSFLCNMAYSSKLKLI